MSFLTKINGFIEILHFDNRTELLLQKFFNPKQDLQIYKFKDIEILSSKRANDISAFRSVFVNNEYKQYLNYLRKMDIRNVIDCGANIGTFALLIKLSGITAEKIVCVEYNKNTYDRLKFNLIHNLPNVALALHAAVINEDRVLHLNMGNGGSGDSIYKSDKNANLVNVNGMTLNSIINSYFNDKIIDLLKIDVEGSEYEIFGMKEKLNFLKSTRFLIIEIHPYSGMDVNAIINKLKQCDLERIPGQKSENKNLYFFKNKIFDNNGS